MTNGMRVLEKYIQQYKRENPGMEIFEVEFISEGTVKVIDDNGVHKWTMNLFCDIMNADSKEIIAESNISHNLTKVGNQIPTEWNYVSNRRKDIKKKKQL